MSQHPIISSHNVRSTSYRRTILRVRIKLHPLEKVISTIIHIPIIETLSEALTKIFRPSVLIGGSLGALLSTWTLYGVVTHHGYSFNFFASIAGYAVGVVIGLSVEFIDNITKNL